MDKLSWHWGLKKIVLGALLLLNALVWPKWLGIDGWIQFFAVLMVIFGLLHFVCPARVCGMPAPKVVKRKR